jgi:hypothetical protein
MVFDKAFTGETKVVAVYDLRGRLEGIKTVTKDAVDLHRDFGVSSGVHIVKVRTIR